MDKFLIFYILTIFGACLMWNFAKIFLPIRNFIAKYFGILKQPFLCGECSSFWIGLFFTGFVFRLDLLESICMGLISYCIYFIFEKIYFKN